MQAAVRRWRLPRRPRPSGRGDSAQHVSFLHTKSLIQRPTPDRLIQKGVHRTDSYKKGTVRQVSTERLDRNQIRGAEEAAVCFKICQLLHTKSVCATHISKFALISLNLPKAGLKG